MSTKERPIIFNAEMVQALLDGKKTQTRRVIKDPAWIPADWLEWSTVAQEAAMRMRCPYGKPGDRLWVRESFRYYHDSQGLWDCIQYADGSMMKPDGLGEADGHRFSERCSADAPWRPSIHMPRWASRILLDVVAVRVERLQDISKADAISEGVEEHDVGGWYRDYLETLKPIGRIWHSSPIKSFASLIDSIKGPGTWDANPWVWVVEFERVTP